MGALEQELEELTKQLAEAETVETETPVEEEPADAPEDAEADQDIDIEEDAEEKPEDKPEEKPLDDAGYARLRRELAAERKARQELEARIAPAQTLQQPEIKAVDSPEPDVNKDPIAWVKWNKEQIAAQVREIAEWKQAFQQQTERAQLEHQAINEFKSIEAEFKASVADFDDVAQHLNNRIFDSIRALNPYMSEDEVAAKAKNQILTMASRFAQQGLNPVEELYHMTKEKYGYTVSVQDEEDQPKKKPDLSRVAANKKRNAGMAAAKGASSMPQLTREVAADMPVHEWAALSPDEKRRLLSNG